MSAVIEDFAWLGAQAAARLPREVDLQAGGPLAATVRAEIARLRALAEGADGSLVLHDPATARAAGIDDGVLAQLAAAG